MPDKAAALQLLRTAVNDPNAEFRDGQWEAISDVTDGQGRHLVVQKTGWGKSLIYFLSTKILRGRGAGPTLVISPLLALMRDQARAADRLGLRAERIDSSNKDSWAEISELLERDAVDLLLISPERLANRAFLAEELPRFSSRLQLLVVDEAHCISDWGHDFRPDYRRIRSILQQLPPNIRLLTVTATANDRVVADLEAQLGPGLQVTRGDMVRDSLSLQRLQMPTQLERYAWLAERLPELDGSGIIYVLTKRDADRLSRWLQSEGILAEAYYSGSENREELEDRLLRNELKVLVATTALAMGFDKPDLGFVIHFQTPQSLVHYYQQVGRAGRAIDQALGVLLTGDEDRQILEYFVSTAFPDENLVQSMMEHLRAAGNDGLSMTELYGVLNVRQTRLAAAVKFLSCEVPAPVSLEGYRVKLNPIRGYRLPLQRFAEVNARRIAEMDETEDYVATDECLMKFLQRSLGDSQDQLRDCGRCENCTGRQLVHSSVSDEVVARARKFLGKQHIVIQPRKQWPLALAEELKARGLKRNLGDLRNEPGMALCHYSDPIVGKAVHALKVDKQPLPDSIYHSVIEMIREVWRPDPAPEYVVCIPSLRNPGMVPEIARLIAGQLAVPFVEDVIRKTRETEPQKLMLNSDHQARNIFDAFSVRLSPDLADRPLLLVDDIVDSKWTFTVVGALLRQAGSGEVYPLAVASTAND